MESVDGSAYLYISEEGLIAPIPDEWQLPKTPVERLTLRLQDRPVTSEHPNDEIYRQMFLGCQSEGF